MCWFVYEARSIECGQERRKNPAATPMHHQATEDVLTASIILLTEYFFDW
jgi:hypothetical protein